MRKSDLVSLTAAILAVLMVLLLFFAVFADSRKSNDQYTNVAKVMAIYEADNIVVCEDSAGLLWAFYGTEDWQVGDCVGLLMDTHGTDYTVLDDMVISARYCAWNVR